MSGACEGIAGNLCRVADCELSPYEQRPKPATEEAKANAARIVACVNACAGIDPAAVPAMVKALGALASVPGYLETDHKPSEVTLSALIEAMVLVHKALALAKGGAL